MNNSELPARPIVDVRTSTSHQEIFYGLTKREYFAGLALQALINVHSNGSTLSVPKLTSQSLLLADALLKELSGNEK